MTNYISANFQQYLSLEPTIGKCQTWLIKDEKYFSSNSIQEQESYVSGNYTNLKKSYTMTPSVELLNSVVSKSVFQLLPAEIIEGINKL